MKNALQTLLLSWPKPLIRDQDLKICLPSSQDARYSLTKRALKAGWLMSMKKGLYLIEKPYRQHAVNLYEVAQSLYGPSYISLESALSYHQWIPETVYTTTSVTSRRKKDFDTSVGVFSFTKIPEKHFYLGVERIEVDESVFFMAQPWKALADYCYVYKKRWNSIQDIYLDLRIEIDALKHSDLALLKQLSISYPNKKIQYYLKKFLGELNNVVTNN